MNAVDTVTTRHEPLRTTQASPAASIPATATSNYTVRYISAPPVRLLQPTRSSPLSLSRCIDNRRWPASPTRGLRRTRRLRISSRRRTRITRAFLSAMYIPHCDILLFSETLIRLNLASLIHSPILAALIHSPIRTSTYPLVLSFCDFVVTFLLIFLPPL